MGSGIAPAAEPAVAARANALESPSRLVARGCGGRGAGAEPLRAPPPTRSTCVAAAGTMSKISGTLWPRAERRETVSLPDGFDVHRVTTDLFQFFLTISAGEEVDVAAAVARRRNVPPRVPGASVVGEVRGSRGGAAATVAVENDPPPTLENDPAPTPTLACRVAIVDAFHTACGLGFRFAYATGVHAATRPVGDKDAGEGETASEGDALSAAGEWEEMQGLGARAGS